jgi:hypothetical protein
MESAIIKKLETLPESLQIEVLHYIEFLHDKYTKNSPSIPPESVEEPTEETHGYGSLAGKIIIADDFDEPLEELEEYM